MSGFRKCEIPNKFWKDFQESPVSHTVVVLLKSTSYFGTPIQRTIKKNVSVYFLMGFSKWWKQFYNCRWKWGILTNGNESDEHAVVPESMNDEDMLDMFEEDDEVLDSK